LLNSNWIMLLSKYTMLHSLNRGIKITILPVIINHWYVLIDNFIFFLRELIN